MKRWGGALTLGAGVVVAAVAFGSRPLGVAGVGLLLAAGLSRAWAALVQGPVSVVSFVEPTPALEGDRVTLSVEVRRASRIPVASTVVRATLGRLGSFEWRLKGRGRGAVARIDLGALSRGCFSLSDERVVLSDFLGLETVSPPVTRASTAVVVYPRLVELAGLFSDAGRMGGDGRRLLIRRTSGFDFHSVREYEQGESLRRVHWPTSARRGQLMVKELEDAPRDSVTVVLDCDPAGAAGQPPDSSFDAAARAAGSILKTYVARGRSATLVTTGSERAVVSVRSGSASFAEVLTVLAAADADARHGLARALSFDHAPIARSGELVVVTATLEPTAVSAILALAGGRTVSVVLMDAPSWASRPTRANPGALRLSASGIPVVVVRQGEDLAAVLGPGRLQGAAHG